ncbi:MAG: type II toxin-antitoxin system YafQ family toxin [Bacteroides sp.]|nr:type II toxin-antitoxin system YafQ family toxin [Bacteroides sp.]
MKRLHPTSQYKKDYKRYRNKPAQIKQLFEILEKLQYEELIPEVHKPHMLTGDYAGCMECHIESDFLLIWFDPDTEEIDLLRLGSHSELFGKGAKK